ncbi:Glycine/D-amino acid oxidase [Clostridium amylolyticum]|uniref:Glycine/D-amino acid oxidase n=1 Tax=Clostridium amylolyticum TaxID=1121298 RepID=A0A1M6F1I2_9CLOT|nr:FAD-dependent oxidoreductase [Clostridium amylolyticum]SHI91578.1 Glycine/D-amino acid oxidase [Clostridium amylolyticum]
MADVNSNNFNNNNLPEFPESYWINSTTFPSFKKLSENISTDVVVVGAGITGVTTAYLLCKEGLKVTLLDAGKILNGTTGHTTAKITVQHSLIYDELITNLGKEKAQYYYNANNDALQFINKMILDNNIPCDYVTEDAYIYTNSEEYEKKLINELIAYEKLGIEGEYLDSIPIPVDAKHAIKIKNQGAFHPLKYIYFMINYLIEKQCNIYEDTKAVDIKSSEIPVVITECGNKIKASNVVICTHFPFYDGRGLYFARMYPERSYVLGVKAIKIFSGGMYINAEDPGRSLRSTPYKGKKLLLIGGENHKTGQGEDTLMHYEMLREFAKETFGINSIVYRWSAQDLTTLDKIPYIGRIASDLPNIYVATGYRKWGITNGTAAAKILRDMIIGVENPYVDLFTPSRFNADPSLKNVFVQNADVAKNLIKGKLETPLEGIDDVNLDQGKVISYKGRRAGAYKDKEGKIHIVDTTCTHLGCELQWNSGERTWDCPCHGSRFSYRGEIIEGPALKPLEVLE